MNKECPCGSGKEFSDCCEPYIRGEVPAPTPEALMRSRYSAYTIGNIPYLKETLLPGSRGDFNEADARSWSQVEWRGLEVLRAEGTTVEFVAKYKTKDKVLEHHEVSKFRKQGERWYFVDGESHIHEEGQGHHHGPKVPEVREAPKVGRNDPCVCGSGKKFKKCCGAA